MMQDERYSAIECILFVSGEPVSLVQLQRALDAVLGAAVKDVVHQPRGHALKRFVRVHVAA